MSYLVSFQFQPLSDLGQHDWAWSESTRFMSLSVLACYLHSLNERIMHGEICNVKIMTEAS